MANSIFYRARALSHLYFSHVSHACHVWRRANCIFVACVWSWCGFGSSSFVHIHGQAASVWVSKNGAQCSYPPPPAIAQRLWRRENLENVSVLYTLTHTTVCNEEKKKKNGFLKSLKVDWPTTIPRSFFLLPHKKVTTWSQCEEKLCPSDMLNSAQLFCAVLVGHISRSIHRPQRVQAA